LIDFSLEPLDHLIRNLSEILHTWSSTDCKLTVTIRKPRWPPPQSLVLHKNYWNDNWMVSYIVGVFHTDQHDVLYYRTQSNKDSKGKIQISMMSTTTGHRVIRTLKGKYFLESVSFKQLKFSLYGPLENVQVLCQS
jgi:hypothetical protein